MGVKPGQLMEDLEQACSGPHSEFIFAFLSAFSTPKATITQIRNGGARNVAEHDGAVALKRKLYFLPVESGTDLGEAIDELSDQPLIARHRIRFAIVTDFNNLLARDLVSDERLDCGFQELPRNYAFFLPLAGYERARVHDEAEADIKAAERMGRLCDNLRDHNPVESAEQRHALNVFLTRLLFCLYAEDTGIFRENQFTETLKANTAADGSDTSAFFESLFDALNRSPEDRDGLPEHLADFPYVNGGLFEDALPVPTISARARRMLIDAGELDWKAVNPDIFGSMFQAVIDPEQRGELGQHYTSVTNILKVIRPLFLDDLEAELERSRGSRKRLTRLLDRLHSLKVFDPACGSGNFLIIAYKELRRIEMQAFQALNEANRPEPLVPETQPSMFPDQAGQQPLTTAGGQREIFMSGIHLDQFYGIEIDDFAHEVAKLALWIAEHQMQQEFRDAFGYAEPSLPLKSGGKIVCASSLEVDWAEICSREADDEVYVCGNPPYLGWRNRSPQQNAEMENVFQGFRLWKNLDYVASWFWKGARYIRGTRSQCAFVSTNSICQGEQVSMLWPYILNLGIEIRFAHQTFAWKNYARGNAGVHVIVVGLADASHPLVNRKRLYFDADGKTHHTQVEHISPYLLEGPDAVVTMVSRPLMDAPRMLFGNMPNDGGGLLLTSEERADLIAAEPEAEKWIKPLLGSDEYLKGKERWCLWLLGATNAEIEAMPVVAQRVEYVRQKRLASKDVGARKLAERPHEFRDTNNPTRWLLVPSVSSERRNYVPVGFFGSETIASNLVYMVPNAGLCEFAILSSEIHMDWLRLVGGRLKSDYRYSAGLVYNTFPWPNPTDAQRSEIEARGQDVLDVRERYFNWTMGEMYDPDKMPEDLLAAHKALDAAVERVYRKRPFRDQAERQQFLLERYQALVSQEAEHA